MPGLTYDTATRVMKDMGAKKVAAVGYGASPSSSESAKATETYGADAVGLKGVYLNNTLEFGGTDVGPIVLGIKNSGADGLYLPLDSDTNFAIVQGLQQNGVKMKSNVLATGYSQDLLDQPIAKTITPQRRDVQPRYRPVELGGKAVKQFRADLKKYARPHRGARLRHLHRLHRLRHGHQGPQGGGQEPDPPGLRRRHPQVCGQYDGAGLTCQPLDAELRETSARSTTTAAPGSSASRTASSRCSTAASPSTGKLVGDPALIAKYESNTGGVTTTAPPATAAP